jgi:hypothetical protein
MGRFEIHNYGKNVHFPYKKDEVFLYRNRTERTDDEELAAICEKFPSVGVVDKGEDFTQLTKPELVERAKEAGISNAHNRKKAELIELINSATEVHSG